MRRSCCYRSPRGPRDLLTFSHIVCSFEDRYGSDREVPLLEMIDPEFGIGVPAAYDKKKAAANAGQSATWRERRDMLFEIARIANDERRLEVELDAEVTHRLRTWVPDVHSAPASLEINVFVSARSPTALDEGQFTVVVGPNVGAMEAGRSLGRFAQPLGSSGATAYARAARADEDAAFDERCVELSYLPRIPQLANILVRPSRHRFEINVGLQPGVPFDQSIPVSELLVGVRAGRFYVRSPPVPARFADLLRAYGEHRIRAGALPSPCGSDAGRRRHAARL